MPRVFDPFVGSGGGRVATLSDFGAITIVRPEPQRSLEDVPSLWVAHTVTLVLVGLVSSLVAGGARRAAPASHAVLTVRLTVFVTCYLFASTEIIAKVTTLPPPRPRPRPAIDQRWQRVCSCSQAQRRS